MLYCIFTISDDILQYAFPSDANVPHFGEIRRFFDQIGYFYYSSKTGEKMKEVEESWAIVNERSLF